LPTVANAVVLARSRRPPQNRARESPGDFRRLLCVRAREACHKGTPTSTTLRVRAAAFHCHKEPYLFRRRVRLFRPYRASGRCVRPDPGRCPGLCYCAPFGLTRSPGQGCCHKRWPLSAGPARILAPCDAVEGRNVAALAGPPETAVTPPETGTFFFADFRCW